MVINFFLYLRNNMENLIYIVFVIGFVALIFYAAKQAREEEKNLELERLRQEKKGIKIN